MKARIEAIGDDVRLVLLPETAGEQRILDFLVMNKPLEDACDFDDVVGSIAFKARHSGHKSHRRVEQLVLMRVKEAP